MRSPSNISERAQGIPDSTTTATSRRGTGSSVGSSADGCRIRVESLGTKPSPLRVLIRQLRPLSPGNPLCKPVILRIGRGQSYDKGINAGKPQGRGLRTLDLVAHLATALVLHYWAGAYATITGCFGQLGEDDWAERQVLTDAHARTFALGSETTVVLSMSFP